MQVLAVRNAHKALPEAVHMLKHYGSRRSSRNGDALVMSSPVTTVFRRPMERVLFWPERDANPFFHLMESLHMVGGRNDVDFLTRYVRRMADFSDDGTSFHGAYGFRWRKHFDVDGGGRPGLPDQLPIIIDRLTRMPEDRRCVLTMWDPVADLGVDSRDLPCNTQIYFGRNASGALDMTVLCRSNDAVLGALGANVVHMSFLQEFMASSIGCEVGRYWQVSNNYHAYVGNDWEKVADLDTMIEGYSGLRPCPYELGEVVPYPIMSVTRKVWEEDLAIFLAEGPITGFREPFFHQVVTPMHHAHAAYRAKDYAAALEIIAQCQATDWHQACTEWLLRRRKSYEEKRL
jgi:thymidylate synthase